MQAVTVDGGWCGNRKCPRDNVTKVKVQVQVIRMYTFCDRTLAMIETKVIESEPS